jgi:hypothetical protein
MKAFLRRYERFLEIYQETSAEAWESVQTLLPVVDAKILAVLRESPSTSEEIERLLGMKHQTVSAQIRHMVEAGLVRDTTLRRKTKSGRSANVWEIVPPDAIAPKVDQGLSIEITLRDQRGDILARVVGPACDRQEWMIPPETDPFLDTRIQRTLHGFAYEPQSTIAVEQLPLPEQT